MSVNSENSTIDEERSSSHQMSLRARPRPMVVNTDDGSDGSIESVTMATNIRRRDRHRVKTLVKKRREARISAQIESAEVSRLENNLRTYTSWNLGAKIDFAHRGYIFDSDPDHPAIEIYETVIRTAEDMGRGIRAGTAMPYLPLDFVILFSWSHISREQATGRQSYFQLLLPRDFILMMHTQPVTTYGLANLINAAVSAPNRSGPIYAEKVRVITKQNMTVKNCEFVTQYTSLNPLDQVRNPAYVQVIKPIPPGYELLLPKNYNQRRKIF
jgi:hypothetical protein